MKKLFLLLLLAVTTLVADAQQLFNTSFEDEWVNCFPWESGAIASKARGTQPEGWCISNVSSTMLPIVGEDVTPGANGSEWAVKLTNVKASIGNNTAPGYITLGTSWATAETMMTDVRNADGGVFGGVSFSYHPDAVRLTYKHDIESGSENMSVIAYLWKGTWTQKDVPCNTAVGVFGWGTAVKKDMTDRIHNILGKECLTGGEVSCTEDAALIASAEYYSNTAQEEWLTKEIPLDYGAYAGKPVDVEKLNIVISANGLFDDRSIIKAGNSVTIDDVELVYWHALSALSYEGETLNFSETKTNYELSAEDYDETKLSYTVKGQAATATTSYDEETGVLTIRVEGEDINVNPESYTEYKLQFGASLVKLDVEWNWNASSRYPLNTTVENAFVLKSGDTTLFTFSSSNEAVAKLENGTLKIGNQTGAAIITVSCVGSRKWNSRVEQYEVQAVAPCHVPFDLTKDYYEGVKGNISGGEGWDANGGIRLGNNSDIFSWGNKSFVMQIAGIPDKLTFSYSSSKGASSRQYVIYESADGENYTEIWRDNRGSGVDGNSYWCNDLQLSHDTRFIKFFYYGNCAAYYREISVTELVKFESDTEEIVLNETNNTTSFTFTHANARTGFITVTAPQGIAVDVPEFECGLDIYGEQTIGVTYDWLSGVDVEDDIIISDGAKTKRVHVVARIENPDGIVSPMSDAEEAGVIYNLAGQRIMKMQKGINIIGGRKVLK